MQINKFINKRHINIIQFLITHYARILWRIYVDLYSADVSFAVLGPVFSLPHIFSKMFT